MRHLWILLIPLAFAAGFAVCYLWKDRAPEPLETNADATIGFIGCSNTAQSVMGYHMAGGDDLWQLTDDRKHDFDSGTVREWANIDNDFWHTFDRYLGAHPNTRVIWWQLCVPRDDTPTLADAQKVIAGIKGRIPGVEIYVSALPSYQTGVCRITGTEGLARGEELVRELAAQGDVHAGPTLAPHAPEEVLDDGCHLTEKGMRAVGTQLKQFFDAL
ncbi:hypothetical protein HY416_00430 [Candidatus Kaiserbacteria bacterium]|nr:hypothetical protein [Candidatus Kaiserbacteria bacterium]